MAVYFVEVLGLARARGENRSRQTAGLKYAASNRQAFPQEQTIFVIFLF